MPSIISPLLAAAIVFASTLAPNHSVRVTLVDSPVAWNGGQAWGLAYCVAGQPEIQIIRDAPLYLWEHEWLHAAACVADGEFLARSSSLDPSDCATDPSDCPHSWVFWALRNPGEAAALLNTRLAGAAKAAHYATHQ